MIRAAEFDADGLRDVATAMKGVAEILGRFGGDVENALAGGDICLRAIAAYEQLSDRFLAERTEHSATVGRLLDIIADLRGQANAAD